MDLTRIFTWTNLHRPHPAVRMDKDRIPHASHDEQISSEKRDAIMNVSDSDQHANLGAILKTHPINTWGAGSLHLYAICLLVYLCSTMNGLSRS